MVVVEKFHCLDNLHEILEISLVNVVQLDMPDQW